MKKPRTNLTQERLKECLHYDPITGDLIGLLKGRKNHGRPTGYRMGLGYLQVGVDGVIYLAHRLVWLYHHGAFPPQHLDHIDGDPTNNRISNLRPASQKLNTWNSKTPTSNKSGYKGVFWLKEKRRWLAYCRCGDLRFRKSFTSKKEAIHAVREARERLHGEFANHGS